MRIKNFSFWNQDTNVAIKSNYGQAKSNVESY